MTSSTLGPLPSQPPLQAQTKRRCARTWSTFAVSAPQQTLRSLLLSVSPSKPTLCKNNHEWDVLPPKPTSEHEFSASQNIQFVSIKQAKTFYLMTKNILSEYTCSWSIFLSLTLPKNVLLPHHSTSGKLPIYCSQAQEEWIPLSNSRPERTAAQPKTTSHAQTPWEACASQYYLKLRESCKMMLPVCSYSPNRRKMTFH